MIEDEIPAKTTLTGLGVNDIAIVVMTDPEPYDESIREEFAQSIKSLQETPEMA